MTQAHTSTEQPYMPQATLHPAQEECIRLQARILELEAAVETGKRLLREEMARANRYAEAAQSQRAPLSDAEIRELYNEESHWDMVEPYVVTFARAIEQAHGITQEKQG